MFLQRYYSNLFIAVMIEAGVCRLFAQVVKNRHVIKTFEAVFNNEDEDSADKKVIEYIKDISKDYKASYLSFCLNSIGQGAFRGVDFEANSVDKNSVTAIGIKNDWTIYASYIDINWAKNMFKPITLDLLYSPFVFLHEEIKKREISQKATIYIYNFEDSFALAIFEKGRFFYGGYFRTKQKTLQIDEIDEKPYEEVDKIEEFENHEVKDMDEYESFDDLDETLEFNVSDDMLLDEVHTEIKEEVETKEDDTSIEHLGRDITMYNYILESIREVYAKTEFKENFIEDIVIFDNCGVANTVINMLKDEQFMNVEVFKVNALKDMCNIAIKDISL